MKIRVLGPSPDPLSPIPSVSQEFVFLTSIPVYSDGLPLWGTHVRRAV